MSDQDEMTPNAHAPGSFPPTPEAPTVPTMFGMPFGMPYGAASAAGSPNPWYKPQWAQISRRNIFIASLALVLILVSAGVAVIVVSHVFSKPDGYLLNSTTDVTFIQFTEDQSEHLTGSLQSVYATSDETVQNQSAAFTGIRNGSQVSLTFSALGFSATVQGTLNGDTLTIQMPDQNGYVATEVFQGASTADYNNAAAALRRRILRFAAATQAAQATVNAQQAAGQATAAAQQAAGQATAAAQNALDQAVTDANNQLSNDLTTLNADVQHLAGNTDFSDALNAYASDWAGMQKDYQQEQSDYSQGCGSNGYNASVVAYDATTVNYDLSTIQYDDSVLSGDESSVNTALNSVQSDMRAIQTDWQNLQAAVTADTTGSVSAAFSQSDVNTAQTKAQQQIDASNAALQTAQVQGQHYDQEAAQTNTAAQNLANSMHC